MKKMLLASFSDMDKASEVVDQLREDGYEREEISLVATGRAVAFEYGRDKSTDKSRAENILEDAGTGAAVGGLAGLLLSVLGVVILGPISLALGLTGIIGTTLTGAVVGAATGGLVGMFTDLGVPEETARKYEKDVLEGGAVIGVSSEDMRNAQSIFDKANSNDVTEINLEE